MPRDGETLGEVMFRGNIVMKGYLKNPAATGEGVRGRLVPLRRSRGSCTPTATSSSRTGSKDIIISGGENISSIEVEDALYHHPAVLEAAVVARPDETWGEIPCAFVTLREGTGAVTGDDVIAFCRDHLRGTRCRGRWCSARCRRPRPARSGSTSCANAPRRCEPPISVQTTGLMEDAAGAASECGRNPTAGSSDAVNHLPGLYRTRPRSEECRM